MGLRVQDLHEPSVQSTAHSPTKDVRLMIDRRDQMERELDALTDVLKSHNVDMDTPLVSNDGFPRDDIDVATVRTTRARILRLRNDLIALMADIEQGLHEYFASKNGHTSDSTTANPVVSSSGFQNSGQSHSQAPFRQAVSANGSQSPAVNGVTRVNSDVAFCYVNAVSPSSPAETAGLESGDKIISFGYVNASNHQNLSRLSTLVAGNMGVSVN
jgi:26S proteasome regulatory subunit N4